MERIRDMGLGFLVYLFVLGVLYVVSDKEAPEAVQNFASEKYAGHENEWLNKAYDSKIVSQPADRAGDFPGWQAGGQNEAVLPAAGGKPTLSSSFIQSGKTAFPNTGFLKSFFVIEKGTDKPF